MSFRDVIDRNAVAVAGLLPLDKWSISDLIELEAAANSEIQDRMRQDEDDYFDAEETFDGNPWDA